ncbi:acyl-[acyl-carrier-protein]--UDP-N-acetylglucosamine O-acyltransferase [filamentous cyanobacterium CCP5]|nr:acyl-[acyl-carrier-protein]--UDP-N-acetylglucosamine O-acyltransferase [filamentous cyanobacterium CCP5]
MPIHPTAVVETGASLGQNVEVGPFSYIAKHTSIGDGCQIGAHVTILPYTTLGHGCQVHPGAVIGGIPQDFAFDQTTISYTRIGNHCILREGVTIHRGTKPDTVTHIGSHCLLMANSHVGHNGQLGNQVIMANGALVAGYVEIGDRAFISGNVAVHQFVRIGRLVMLSGGCTVTKDVPPFCMTQSSATNSILRLNQVGLQRAGLTSSDCHTLKRAFKLLFSSGLSTPTALDKLRHGFSSPLIDELVVFIEQSQRGICRRFRSSRP